MYAALYDAAEKTMYEHALKENLEMLQAVELYEKNGAAPAGWEIETQRSVTQ